LAGRRIPSLEPTVPLTAAEVDEIGPSDLSKWTVQFTLF
jgi:hypothetical protein